MLANLKKTCATCIRGGRSFAGRYREFLLEPGTLFTLSSLLLLIAASVSNPGGMLSGGELTGVGAPLYLASALAGSAYIWWSALQGIRKRDFTADIPVSIATAAAIAIGEYSAAAVVAVLLLVGGMLEEFVAARQQGGREPGGAPASKSHRPAWRSGHRRAAGRSASRRHAAGSLRGEDRRGR